MKQEYIAPELEIIEFETEDIITTSSDPLQTKENQLPFVVNVGE